ncbi:MAG: alanine racemase [Pseudohongiellaceae bacterium]
MQFNGRAQASIDLGAVANNFRVAQRHGPHSRLVGVVKSNAYGHGLVQVADALVDADILAVTDLYEAQQLAPASAKPVLILQGLISDDDIRAVAESGFQLVVQSLEQLALIEDRLTRTPPVSPLTFWLKLDTGMGRLGLAPADYLRAWRELAGKPYTGNLVMMTHLANSSLPGSDLTQIQLQTFAVIKNRLGDVATSIPSSSGLLRPEVTRSDWLRPGIMLYGSSPFPWEYEELRADKFGLQPVMTLQSRIIAVKDAKAGDNIGYCSQFICARDMKIGIVSIGYADGYPSNAPNGTPVLVNGKRTQTVGRVSMDMLAVDLSHLPDTRVGDTVTLWGQGLAIDEVAAKTGILSYNLMCSVTRRVQFVYLPGGPNQH